jgi:hypothetical protein
VSAATTGLRERALLAAEQANATEAGSREARQEERKQVMRRAFAVALRERLGIDVDATEIEIGYIPSRLREYDDQLTASVMADGLEIMAACQWRMLIPLAASEPLRLAVLADCATDGCPIPTYGPTIKSLADLGQWLRSGPLCSDCRERTGGAS